MSGLLLDVIRGKKPGKTPIWIMRQAGRYLPEYQKLRQKHDFLTLCLTPELAAEATLLPLRILDVDAAIIFSDILIPCLSMGFELDFIEGKGPLISNPPRALRDIKAIKTPGQTKEIENISQAISMVRNELSPEKALIGFSAAPFTLACYLFEGGSSSHFLTVKRFLYSNPHAFHLLMEKITQTLLFFLNAQAKADVIQVFDTWGGILSPSDFQKFSLPYLKLLISEFKRVNLKPLIYFTKGSGGFFPILKELEVEVMGIDWTLDLGQASRILEDRFILQGNLDPSVLLSKKEIIKEKATEILLEGKKIKGHIFNLGHGILPSTPVENARFLVDIVHSYSTK